MKKLHLLLSFLLISTFTFSQTQDTTGVEKSTYGIQTGLLGVYGYGEHKLGNKLALRTEAGLDMNLINNQWAGNDAFFTPKISIEPRYYYNIDKRAKKGKNVKNNASNYLSLFINHRPNWFEIPSKENIDVVPDLLIAPTWGMKRNISDNFNFELGLGLGYYRIFYKHNKNKSELGVNLSLRIGYIF